MINKSNNTDNMSNNTDDKSRSTRTVILTVAIILLVAACATFDGDEEVDLDGYSDIHEILVADDQHLLIRE